MIHTSKSGCSGFTLIELLIVIVIIGTLTTALVPRLTGIQAKARDQSRSADIRALQTALAMYAADNNGYYPTSNGACIGGATGERCRPGYQQNGVEGGGNGGTGTNAFYSSAIDTIFLKYISSIPLDPQPNRSIGGRYIYWKSDVLGTPITCNGAKHIYGKAFLARQPDKINPRTEKLCAPGTYACCSVMGCGPNYFCVLQLEE